MSKENVEHIVETLREHGEMDLLSLTAYAIIRAKPTSILGYKDIYSAIQEAIGNQLVVESRKRKYSLVPQN